ncbi:MAG: DUF4266 domain-containing protein [Candidatus Eisenbacteria bacterium]
MSPRRCNDAARMAWTLTLAAVLLAACSGCAMRPVPAYQREHLVDPIMSFKAQAKKDARLTKSFEAREGSTGGNGGEGGGCACN